jgi:hypothetical protein
MTTESTSVLDEIQSTDDAFLSASTPNELNGVELEPYSLMRQTIAMELVGLEANMFFDAVITVWICTLSKKQALATRKDRDLAREQAFDWAEAQGFSLSNFRPLIEIYRKLENEIEKSTNARAKDSGNHSGNVGGSQV